MSIKVESSTDTEAQVLAAQGGSKEPTPKASEQKEEVKVEAEESAADEKSTEKLEASETQDEETDEGSEGGKESEAQKPKGSKLQKRISKLVAKASAAEQERDYWREQATKAQAQTTNSPKESKTEVQGKPKTEDFASHEEWVEAVAEWKAEQKLQEREQKAKELKLQEEAQSAYKTHQERVSEFAKTHSDFDEVIHAVDDIPISAAVQEAILDSEHGPALMYELAKDPETYEELCKMPPLKVFREIGKIEAKIQAKTSEKKPETKTTKAPPPITPVDGKTSSSAFDPETASFREYRKWRETQFR